MNFIIIIEYISFILIKKCNVKQKIVVWNLDYNLYDKIYVYLEVLHKRGK